MAATAFDNLADGYDRAFTHTSIGMRMRQAVWRRCAARFQAGDSILEMNCGTGEDALWLAAQGIRVLATDVSRSMLDTAETKRRLAPQGSLVRLRQLAWEDRDPLGEGPFDGALSNFGGLNCVADLRTAAQTLAARLRPGAVAILVVMGPVVPWEWVWFFAKTNPSSAFRRLRRGGVRWSGMTVRYPLIRQARCAFAPEFRTLRVSALGALLPPPYAEAWAARHPRLVGALDRIERRFENVWPLPWLADHYILELQRL